MRADLATSLALGESPDFDLRHVAHLDAGNLVVTSE